MAKARMKIGVVMPIGEDDALGRAPGFREIRDLARQAEAANLDSIWVIDHLLFRFGDKPTVGIHECWTIVSALAAVTERVEIGTLVICTAFRNPALLAKMAATADEVSGGRLILGLGAGWHQPEFDAFGIPFDHLASRFEEALNIIVPLLHEGRVDFRGTYYSAPNCELLPRSQRPNGMPILIGAGKPRMLRLTARHADSWNTCWLGRASALAPRRAHLEAALQAENRDPASFEVTVGVSITTPADAAGATEPLSPDKTLSGSPDEIAAALREYAELDVGHVICSLSTANPQTMDWFTEAVRIFRTNEQDGA